MAKSDSGITGSEYLWRDGGESKALLIFKKYH
jgi:hypothetical protein